MHGSARVTLTAVWIAALLLSVRWWEFTLRAPQVLGWTVLFAAGYWATAVVRFGPTLGHARRRVHGRLVLWGGVAAAVLLFTVAVPVVWVGETPVRTVTVAAGLDGILPLWAGVSAVALLWEGWPRIAAVAAVPLALGLALWLFVIRMPGRSYHGPLEPLTPPQELLRDRLAAHVTTLAGTIGPRNEGHPDALRAAERYLESTLRDLGYEVRAHGYTVAGAAYRNLEVELRGSTRPTEVVLVGAHYDSALDAPGANDNGSGVAAVVELARLLADHRPHRTLRFVLFVNEEPPFFDTAWMGSAVYASETTTRRDERTIAMLSIETIGYYSEAPGSQRYPPPFNLFYPRKGNFIGFVGNLGSGRLVRQAIGAFRRSSRFPSEGAASPSWIPGISWSDHLSFWRRGVPAIMITDTAPFRYPFYHLPQDTPERLDYDRTARVVDGLTAVIRDLTDT